METLQIQKSQNFIEELNRLVEQNTLKYWTLNHVVRERKNWYFEKDLVLESTLTSKRDETEIRIFKDVNDELGDASFSLSEADTFETFESELKDALYMCSQATSKNYDLPQKGDKSLNDEHINYNTYYSKELKEQFHTNQLNTFVLKQINLLKEFTQKHSTQLIQLEINACEIFVTLLTHTLQSSAEVEKNQYSTKSYMEIVITAKDTKTSQEKEYIVYKHILDLYNFDFETLFNESLEIAKESLHSKQCKNFEGPVILKDTTIIDFFTPDLTHNSLIAHCFAKLKYQKMSEFEKDQKVIENTKDALSVSSNALVLGSHAFDEFGVSAQNTPLIIDNKLENYYATLQYANYLNINPTGPLGTIEIKEGNESMDELLNDDECIVITSFSSFVPDMISGDFSAEIRLGTHIKNGVETSFKGGLFTGNIFELLKNCKISKEKIIDEGYKGPQMIKFYKGEIIGN